MNPNSAFPFDGFSVRDLTESVREYILASIAQHHTAALLLCFLITGLLVVSLVAMATRPVTRGDTVIVRGHIRCSTSEDNPVVFYPEQGVKLIATGEVQDQGYDDDQWVSVTYRGVRNDDCRNGDTVWVKRDTFLSLK